MKHSRAWIAAFVIGFTSLASLPTLRASPRLGLQSWTCSAMTFDDVVVFAVRHGITKLQFYRGHLDPLAPQEETLRKLAILKKNGLTAYTFGVTATSLDKEANRKVFEFAKLIGARLIVVEPKNPAEWDNLEELVREYDIKLAIHNHGLGSPYGDPAAVKAVLAKRDYRIGVCLDVGWVTAAGFDAAVVFRDYGNRVFDIHLKDRKIATAADGSVVATDADVGKGSTNFAGLFTAIRETNWSGVMAIETGSKPFREDPSALVTVAKTMFDSLTDKK